MRKQGVFMLLVVLTLTSGVWAFVGTAQRFDVGGWNLVEWAGGIGSAEGRNEVMFSQQQEAHDAWRGASAFQKERGMLVQNAVASGPYGPSSVEQNASTTGVQRQAVGRWFGPTSVGRQSLGADLSTLAVRPFGVGSATGTQVFMGSQAQMMATPYSSARQSQSLKVDQYAGVDGATATDPLVNNTVNVKLDQGYVVDRRSPSPWVYSNP